MSRVLITGASSGVGKELAERFAEKKHDLIVTARRINILNEMKTTLEKKHNIQVACIQADLSNISDVKKLAVESDKLGVDVLINNAGIGSFEALWDSSIEWDQSMLNLNINALTYLMQHYLTIFVKNNKGSVINVSSAGGAIIFPGASVYAATKWYVSTLSKEAHLELKEINSKVKVKCVEPGAIQSDFFGGSAVKVGKEKLMEAFQNHYNPEESVTSKEVSKFTIKLLESDKVMGRIVGSKREMWNPEDESNVIKNHIIKAVIDASK